MPYLKQIAGHTRCARIKAYLERGGRALARELMNFFWQERENEIQDAGLAPAGFDWANAMDETREAEGNHLPYHGHLARTFKHFVISPDPTDKITLDELKALAHTWLAQEFPDFEAVIIYHDDNEGRIPHAHIVVNNTNLKTGYRMHTDDARDLNRDLQRMAKEMGLAHFQSDSPATQDQTSPHKTAPRTLQAVHKSRAEERIEREGGYSWLSDIRSRIEVAKYLSADVSEFRANLKALGIAVEESKSRRHRPDWVFSLADEPTRRVCGEKLGVLYGKRELSLYFKRREETIHDHGSKDGLLAHAKTAVVLNDLAELYKLSRALDLCDRYRIASIEGFDKRIERTRQRIEGAMGNQRVMQTRELNSLIDARNFMAKLKLLPVHADVPTKHTPKRIGRTSSRGEVQSPRNTRMSASGREPIEHPSRNTRERSR